MKIGILGGGQLARMLALEGFDLGFEMHILSGSSSDPAAQVSRYWQQGNPDNPDDLRQFLQSVDLATFESEFMNAKLLKEVAAQTNTPIFPDPELMGKLQDRLSQKQLLEQYKIETSPFIEVFSIERSLKILEATPLGLVFKKRKFGYDGYGTFHVLNKSDLHDIQSKVEDSKEGFIAEARVPFKRELAVILARNPDGEIVNLPLVETFQKHSRCFWVKGPIANKNFHSLLKKLKYFLKEINYVGVIAFELFELKGGALWVNEIAPRVHNSGHYSLDASTVSQFTLHLKAIANHSLKAPETTKAFGMLNLLGEGRGPVELQYDPELFLHWYGKGDNRPGRKLGHVNCVAKTPEEAVKKLLKHRRRWEL